jgi:Leucine-rich repeat (LRR) protein
MNKILILSFIILFYSCGVDNSTNPSSIEYYSDDQQFIDDLIRDNNTLSEELLEERIVKVEIDSGIISYYRIEKLYLENLGLTQIPSSIGMLDSLDKLDISYNQLTSVPHQICDIAIVPDSVKLEENKLCVRGPECIEIKYNLQNCVYHYCDDDEQFIDRMIAENINEGEGWSNLSYDSLYMKYIEWPFTKWSPKFKEDQNDSLELRIIEIDWDNIGITTLPEAISNLTELTYLDIAGNNLTKLPTGIKDLSNLVNLVVYENSLITLPSGIGNLNKLEVLEVYNNLLIELPITIGNLTSLLELRLQNNLLETLPSELCVLIPQLTSFNVGCNQLIKNDEIAKCAALEGKLDDQGDHQSCSD